MIYNNLSYTEKKYWNICYADNIECAICHDGLLFMFDYGDIAHILNEYYPRKDYATNNVVWYFQKTTKPEDQENERQIAEYDGFHITVNPQFMYQNFKEILI